MADNSLSNHSAAVRRLLAGNPPDDPDIIGQLTAGISFLTDFWREHYLSEYIRLGGSKIKFLTGSPGSGKSHCLELFLKQAADDGFVAVPLSAKTMRLDDFKEIYCFVYNAAEFPFYLGQCAKKIIAEMGFEPSEVPEGMTFADHLAEQRLLDPLTKREIRYQLNLMFMQNPKIDNNFALCCSLLTGDLLGYPTLEPNNRELLLSWLSATKQYRLSDYRKLGFSPARITKHNARHMLRSLVEIIKISGYFGLVVGVDNLEALMGGGLDAIRYTKPKREDAYESIRELIDEIDTLQNTMFVFAFDAKLAEDETAGLKSYQALWMRIQNEIEGERFNRFCDMANLDRLAAQEYDGAVVAAISAGLADVVNTFSGEGQEDIVPLDLDSADMFAEHLKSVSASVPRKISRMTFKERGSVVVW